MSLSVIDWEIPGAFLNFQSVSPSSWSVLIKAWFSSESLYVFNTMISAGTLLSLFNSMISPMVKSAAFFSCLINFFWSSSDNFNVVINVELICLSCILLLISSYNSLSIENPTTIHKGEMYVNKNPTCKDLKNWEMLSNK